MSILIEILAALAGVFFLFFVLFLAGIVFAIAGIFAMFLFIANIFFGLLIALFKARRKQ